MLLALTGNKWKDDLSGSVWLTQFALKTSTSYSLVLCAGFMTAVLWSRFCVCMWSAIPQEPSTSLRSSLSLTGGPLPPQWQKSSFVLATRPDFLHRCWEPQVLLLTQQKLYQLPCPLVFVCFIIFTMRMTSRKLGFVLLLSCCNLRRFLLIESGQVKPATAYSFIYLFFLFFYCFKLPKYLLLPWVVKPQKR